MQLEEMALAWRGNLSLCLREYRRERGLNYRWNGRWRRSSGALSWITGLAAEVVSGACAGSVGSEDLVQIDERRVSNATSLRSKSPNCSSNSACRFFSHSNSSRSCSFIAVALLSLPHGQLVTPSKGRPGRRNGRLIMLFQRTEGINSQPPERPSLNRSYQHDEQKASGMRGFWRNAAKSGYFHTWQCGRFRAKPLIEKLAWDIVLIDAGATPDGEAASERPGN